MKYLKKFENNDDYNKGDYLLCDFNDIQLYNEIVKLTSDFEVDRYGVNKAEAEIIDNTEFKLIVYPEDIVKKIKPEEIEFYTNIKKYNL